MKKSLRCTVFFLTMGLTAVSVPALDFHLWELQEPRGTTQRDPRIISPSQLSDGSGYADRYFFFDAHDGSWNFLVPQTGSTTRHSQHVRCELRQMTIQGAPAAWKLTNAPSLQLSGMVVKLGGGPHGHTTIAQIFDATLGKPLGEVEFKSTGPAGHGQLVLFFRQNDGAHFYLLAHAYRNQRYTLSLRIEQNTLVVGAEKTLKTFAIDPVFANDRFYYKAGNYDQTTHRGPPGPLYTQVKIFALAVK